MRLTPGQVEELRSAKYIRGRDAAGVIYGVSVTLIAFERAQELTALGAVDATWYVVSTAPNRVEIHTSHPEWFAELEEKIDDARRQR